MPPMPPAHSGFAFPGLPNLHADIYPSISATHTPSLHQPGKTILITGASRGIGRAIALQYAHARVATLILCARTAPPLDAVARAIARINPSVKVVCIALDVSDAASVARYVETVQREDVAGGRVDVLVNNAGASNDWVPLVEAEPAEWWRTLEVNLKGPFLMLRAFLPLLSRTALGGGGGKKSAHVVNVGSIGGNTVLPTSSAYGVSKFALMRLTEFVVAEWGDKGVECVTVHPGGVETELSRDVEILKPYLNDTPELAGGWCVWYTAGSHGERKWLSGRYLAATWDVDRIEAMKEEIVQGDKLVPRMVI